MALAPALASMSFPRPESSPSCLGCRRHILAGRRRQAAPPRNRPYLHLRGLNWLRLYSPGLACTVRRAHTPPCPESGPSCPGRCRHTPAGRRRQPAPPRTRPYLHLSGLNWFRHCSLDPSCSLCRHHGRAGSSRNHVRTTPDAMPYGRSACRCCIAANQPFQYRNR